MLRSNLMLGTLLKSSRVSRVPLPRSIIEPKKKPIILGFAKRNVPFVFFRNSNQITTYVQCVEVFLIIRKIFISLNKKDPKTRTP